MYVRVSQDIRISAHLAISKADIRQPKSCHGNMGGVAVVAANHPALIRRAPDHQLKVEQDPWVLGLSFMHTRHRLIAWNPEPSRSV